jgi:dolichyl-phosphate beta-glucosyltransferase
LTLPNHQSDARGDKPDYSLVLPLYNPGKQLCHTLNELADFVASSTECWELVFVSDGSTDGSAEHIRSWLRDRANVQLLSYTPNRGKGCAVRQGLLAATAPYRIFTDIDLAYPFEDILSVAWQLRAGHHVVIGSRTHPDSMIELSPAAIGYAFRRQIQSNFFGRLVRAMLPLTQRDTQAGLKGFSAKAANLIAPKLQCNGFGFDCELLTACIRFGLSVHEVPVHVRCDAGGSTTNFRSTLRMINELWRIRKSWPATIPPAIETTRREAA